MISFKIKHEGKTHRLKMPSNWDEVTVSQFIRIEQAPEIKGNYLKLLSILSGLDLPIIINTKANLQMQTAEALRFFTLSPPDWEKLDKRENFIFKGKSYKVPKNLEFERFGVKVLLQNKIDQAKEDIVTVIPYAVSIYLQPLIDKGDFDEEKAKAYEKEFLEMRILEVFPIASFFFRKLIESQKYGVKGLIPSPLTRIPRE